MIVKADEPGDHLPVHPCSGAERTYRSCICKIQKETDQGRADRPSGELQGTSAGAGASQRSEAVHPAIMEEDNRPQVALDVNYENGMGVSIGRLREDTRLRLEIRRTVPQYGPRCSRRSRTLCRDF